MYQFSENLNRDAYFFFEKDLITNMNWAMLPKSSKAIYPVIRSYCNKDGKAFPGEGVISAQSGRTEKIVSGGIKGLEGFPGIRIEKYITKRGRHSKRFSCKIPEYKKGAIFPFHREILLGGNWSLLKPTAQALYPVMRHFGYADYYEYWETAEEGTKQEMDVPDWNTDDFKNREFDFCEAEPSILCEYAHISRRSYNEAINDLEKHFLIKSDKGKFLVYLRPPMYYKRDGLNKTLIKKRGIEKEA